jgi:putative NADH-flavin reductase
VIRVIPLFALRGFNDANPPDLLGIRTGKYKIYVDDSAGSAVQGIDGGIYNEDMAVAIVDEVENNKLNHKHWTCTGPIGLKEW